MNITEETKNPLKWGEGWERTRIQDRKSSGGWKKSMKDYRAALVKQLALVGATEVMLSYNLPPSDRIDPGVAAYFNKELKADYSWQEGLGLMTPAPTLDEIDRAYRNLAKKVHPDGPTPDVPIYIALGKHREQARAWIMGTHRTDHEYVICCDRFNEVRLNIAGLANAIRAIRTLERIGASQVMERTFKGFKVALPAHKMEASDVEHATAS